MEENTNATNENSKTIGNMEYPITTAMEYPLDIMSSPEIMIRFSENGSSTGTPVTITKDYFIPEKFCGFVVSVDDTLDSVLTSIVLAHSLSINTNKLYIPLTRNETFGLEISKVSDYNRKLGSLLLVNTFKIPEGFEDCIFTFGFDHIGMVNTNGTTVNFNFKTLLEVVLSKLNIDIFISRDLLVPIEKFAIDQDLLDNKVIKKITNEITLWDYESIWFKTVKFIEIPAHSRVNILRNCYQKDNDHIIVLCGTQVILYNTISVVNLEIWTKNQRCKRIDVISESFNKIKDVNIITYTFIDKSAALTMLKHSLS